LDNGILRRSHRVIQSALQMEVVAALWQADLLEKP
jgi:hypothetical protein